MQLKLLIAWANYCYRLCLQWHLVFHLYANDNQKTFSHFLYLEKEFDRLILTNSWLLIAFLHKSLLQIPGKKNKKIKQVTETTAEGRGKNNKGEKIAVRSNLKAIQSQYNETTRSYKRIWARPKLKAKKAEKGERSEKNPWTRLKHCIKGN